jgi:superfamily II DNA/RNA helicase
MTFDDLGLSAPVLAALAAKGYTQPTPIQSKAIPVILMMRDMIGIAQTGTGKTASFTLPMIEILAGGRGKTRMPRSLVLAPTRELAAQVAENFSDYGKNNSLTHALLVGGESMGDQTKLLNQGVDVLIATPGRMLDLFERGQILLNDIKILVIDEADRMLDMGFIPDIERIVSLIPSGSQKLLFSATMPAEIQKLAEKFLRNPKTVKVDPPNNPAQTVEQHLIWVEERNKRSVLRRLLSEEDVKNAFIFCNRKKDVASLARFLSEKGFKAAPLHGDMPQPMRNKTLQDFKNGDVIMMVCSDVAARGLDVQGVSHVFNYDVPFNPEDYIHRIGRTGRAGREGSAWTIAHGEELKTVRAIEKMTSRKLVITEIDGASVAEPTEESIMLAAPPKRRVAPKIERSDKTKAPIKRAPVVHDEDLDDVGFGADIPAFLR